jgi:hypothetical protein
MARTTTTIRTAAYYFEVSPTQGISEAMQALFTKAFADARISK